jgi:hypothetical protein
MADQATIAQQFFEACSALVINNTGRKPYDLLKDFQPSLAALVALTAAIIAYRGAMAKVDLDRATSERESKSKKLGMFRRLRVAVERLKNALGSNTMDLDEVIRGSFGEIVSDPFAFAAFMQFPEIEDAWTNIASFPPEAVHLIEFVQRAVNEKTGLFKVNRGRRTDFYIKLMENLHPVCVELMQLLDREIAKLESPGFWGKIKRKLWPRPRRRRDT